MSNIFEEPYEPENSIPGTQMSDNERNSLKRVLQAFFEEKDFLEEVESPEIGRAFADFLLGLTFPESVDVGEAGSKRREMMTSISMAWHFNQLQANNAIKDSIGNLVALEKAKAASILEAFR